VGKAIDKGGRWLYHYIKEAKVAGTDNSFTVSSSRIDHPETRLHDTFGQFDKREVGVAV